MDSEQEPSSEILQVEQCALHSLPATEDVALGGWRLRFDHGLHRRGNSVWPNADDGSIPLEQKLARAESFYAARALPVRYQIAS